MEAPPPLYINAKDVAASGDTTQHGWDKNVRPYLILDVQPCTAVGLAQQGGSCHLVPQ